jgi:Uma2 family endonuclease
MHALIKVLQAYYADNPMVYVSGNLLLFYTPGDRRVHLSPDVFVVKGVEKRPRLNYLTWEEGKAPDVVIELTSSSTRDEDVEDKYWLYQDKLKVTEYFLFDPLGDYLKPTLLGYRLFRGKYRPVKPVGGRLPSKVLGLHLEKRGKTLSLYNPETRQYLPTPEERIADTEGKLADTEGKLADTTEKLAQVASENERLRRELEELRRRLGNGR